MDIKKELEKTQSEAFNFLRLENVYLKKLLKASTMLTSADLKDFLNFILEAIMDLTQARQGIIFLCNTKKGEGYELIVSSDGSMLKDEALSFCTGVADKVLKTGKIERIENVINNSDYNTRESVVRLKLKALMCLPLLLHEKVIGILYLDSDQGEYNFREENVKLLEAFCSQAAMAVEHARDVKGILKDNIHLKNELAGSYRFGEIICNSKKMKELISEINKVLDNNITVLINGETGTGKELIARGIHYNGIRKDKMFISQNCGALPISLLESELFGHKKGAFTGANSDKIGLFEAADGGTIFLDEIGEMSFDAQVRLLRVLENRTIRLIGDLTDRKIDIRVVAATNRNLLEMVKEGKFREDLYYRLNVFPVVLPPLRERVEDIPILISHFIDLFNKDLNKQVTSLSEDLLNHLISCKWPGNIRELKNYIYRLMILCTGTRLELPPESPAMNRTIEPPGEDEKFQTMEEVERSYFIRVLKKVNNNKTAAAKILGLKRSTFLSRLQKSGLE